MKLYLDTTALIAFLFGELSDTDTERQQYVARLFQIVNARDDISALVSLYVLQEIVLFVYDNYPLAHAAEVLRLALLVLFQNRIVLVPLLDRIDSLSYRRQADVRDRSDRSHVATALKHGCDYLLTYDVCLLQSRAVTAMRPEEFIKAVAL